MSFRTCQDLKRHRIAALEAFVAPLNAVVTDTIWQWQPLKKPPSLVQHAERFWRSSAVQGTHRPKVVRTNGYDEILVRAANLLIGRAAYETAIRLFPQDAIQYRNGAQIIARKDRETG